MIVLLGSVPLGGGLFGPGGNQGRTMPRALSCALVRPGTPPFPPNLPPNSEMK